MRTMMMDCYPSRSPSLQSRSMELPLISLIEVEDPCRFGTFFSTLDDKQLGVGVSQVTRTRNGDEECGVGVGC